MSIEEAAERVARAYEHMSALIGVGSPIERARVAAHLTRTAVLLANGELSPQDYVDGLDIPGMGS